MLFICDTYVISPTISILKLPIIVDLTHPVSLKPIAKQTLQKREKRKIMLKNFGSPKKNSTFAPAFGKTRQNDL